MTVEEHIEEEMNAIAAKHKDALNSALIQPFSPEWKFCTNGLYLLLATAGCGKSRFIIKHILMSERLFAEPYYSLICYCSTSGELDKTVSTYINSKTIKTKHKFKVKVKCRGKHNIILRDVYPVYSTGAVTDNEIDAGSIEKINKPRLLAWIADKMRYYQVSKPICPLLVVLDDFAGHKLIERKETPLARMMTKCRHYSCTFIIAVQTAKYVIKNIRRQATDIVVWAGLSEEDFYELMKEIQFSYNKDALWNEYRQLKNQKDHLILNVKAHSYIFVRV